ncbi:lipopolysaccharide biosynthesis protein [Streptomyces sp. P9(2023)]|uniref:lipopolysaccharide biosynthesis protein n=1 Tax=Streptomyces sp. P9(2023) TaxID=3064394 RepID=UPI0028F420C5|nr:lipopolysaccharide biosynthesis protein [Streptomyces sp. P9(2023)]MDT9692815.1 lipopolysaccharide biosynthesis protein [Streptomyces sp. P9(2023)]
MKAPAQPYSGPPARPAGGKRARRHDQLTRSSFFLMGSSLAMAVLGFVFWIIVARLYSPEQVGLATTLISATELIAFFSLFGLNSTLIRFLAPPGTRNAQITKSVLLVGGAACILASAYLFGLRWYGRDLLFVRADLLLAAAFVAFCVVAALNQLTDAVFIGARKPQYNLLVDGGVQGLTKIILPLFLVGAGSYGIVTASGGATAAAVLASFFFLWRRTGFRFDLRLRRAPLLAQAGFSAASYAFSALTLVPILVTPLIALHWLGPAAAAYYFVAFQIANLLNTLSDNVGEAMLAEVSYDETRFAEMLRRSAVILAAVQIPASVVLVAAAGLVLRLFGGAYVDHAQGPLIVLTLGALAVALRTWASFGLKLAGSLRHLVVSGVILTAVSVGLAVAWAPRGLLWIGWAWLAGNLASGVYACLALFAGRRSAHRQASTPGPSRSKGDR